MNKKVIEDLAKLLKLDVEELTKAITTEEDVEFKVPELKVFTDEEYKTTIDAIKDNHGKTRYDAGKLAGSEMTLKEASEKVGFESSVKNIDDFLKNYKDTVLKEANIEPSKKIKELEGSLENLRTQLTEKENKISTIESEYKQKETRLQAQSLFPDLPENIGLSKGEASSLFFMSHEVKEDGIYRNGERLKDTHEKPLSIEQAVAEFVAEKKWNQAPAGRGGGAGGGSGASNGIPKSIEEFESYVKAKGIDVASAEANALLNEMAKTNPELLN